MTTEYQRKVAAQQAATAALTPYDKGTRAEPKVWTKSHIEDEGDYGKVDFDAEDGYTIATLHIEKGEDNVYTLAGYANEPLKVAIEMDEDPQDPSIIQPSEALKSRVKEVIARLDTPLERDEASVYWSEGQALILVPGEKGYRKQQAIIVDEPGTEYTPGLGWSSDWNYSGINSAIVKSWSSGLQRTRD